MQTVELWTDGSCSRNPGGAGGWAAVLRLGEHERELTGSDPATTNNRMELQAVVEGLRALTRPCRVLVHTDSRYVRDAVSRGWIVRWQRNGWRTKDDKPIANRDLWEDLLGAIGEHEIEWIAVKGHAGIELNERCDRLAAEAWRTAAAA